MQKQNGEEKMKSAISVWLVVLLGLMILFSCTKKAPQKIEWAVSLENALKIASEKNQNVIAEFWSDG